MVAAALGIRLLKSWSGGFSAFSRTAPYAFGCLTGIAGLFLTRQTIGALSAG